MSVSDINAKSSFDQVRTTFSGEAVPILDLLYSIAANSYNKVRDQDTLNDYEISTVPVPSNMPSDPTEIIEPTPPEIWTGAIDYLDELRARLPDITATFPVVGAVVDAPPAIEPIPINDITGYMQINPPPLPAFTVPEWDDSMAWDGGPALEDLGNNLPVNTFDFTETEYASPMLSEGANVLYDYVKNEIETGNFGVDIDVEDRLFERAREREARGMLANVDNALRVFSSGGFTIPTGAAKAAIDRANAEFNDKVSSVNRDIMVKQADLHLAAKEKTIAAGIEIEKTARAQHDTTLDRALKAAAQRISSTIEIASYRLERVKLYVTKYQSFAAVFEARAKAATSVVELYKSQVEAEGLKAGVNKNLVEEFVAKNRSLVDVLNAEVASYQAYIDGKVRYHGVLADVFKTQTNEMAVRGDLARGAYDMAEKQMGNSVQFRTGKYNAEVQLAQAKISKILSILNFKLEQFKLQAQSMASIATASMSALNVNLGLSVSGSAGVSGSESASEQTSEITSETTSTSHSVSEQTIESEAYNHQISSNE